MSEKTWVSKQWSLIPKNKRKIRVSTMWLQRMKWWIRSIRRVHAHFKGGFDTWLSIWGCDTCSVPVKKKDVFLLSIEGIIQQVSATTESGTNCLSPPFFFVTSKWITSLKGHIGWRKQCFSQTFCCASIFFCDGYCRLTNGNKLRSAGAWMAGSWGVSNSVLKDDEARASGFCGRLQPDWSGHKVLVEEWEKGRTGFRQAVVKLGELTMAALFLTGDMGGGVPRDPALSLSKSEYLTSSQGLTWLCAATKNKQRMARSLKTPVVRLDAVC